MPDIRSAVPEDAETISRLLIDSVTRLCAEDHKNDPETIRLWTANKSVESVRRWLAERRSNFYVAERAGNLAGVGAINSGGHIQLLFVAPAFRFTGISRALLAHLEANARHRGADKATLISSATARRFYLSHGWVETGPPEQEFGMPGYPMAKTLTLD